MMDQSKEVLLEEFCKEFVKLPAEYQNAVAWVLEHFDLAVALCDAEEWTEEERAWLREDAHRKNDPLLRVFVEMETILHSK